MLSLQRWQSYLGLILVEKEETLAARSRLHSIFVSKFIKTEMEKKGELAKLRGKTSVRSETNREKRERDKEKSREPEDKCSKDNVSTLQKSPFRLSTQIKS